MPEIGRWNGMDQLSENYVSKSPYAYVANNPVLTFDVDGRWFNEDGSIGQGPSTWNQLGPKSQSYLSNSMSGGISTNYAGNSGADESYLAFGQTQAYANLMSSFYAGGTGGLTSRNGYFRYWTSAPGFVTVDEYGERETNIGQMTSYIMKLDDYLEYANFANDRIGDVGSVLEKTRNQGGSIAFWATPNRTGLSRFNLRYYPFYCGL